VLGDEPLNASSQLLQIIEEPLTCGLQPWHVLHDRALDLIKIDTQVVVNKHVAQTAQGRPVNVGASLSGGRTEPLSGLGHCLEIPEHRALNEMGGIESRSVPSAMLLVLEMQRRMWWR
jgi:hypothetical protein